ncbi:hypothetical protein HBI62_038030 [Parastagonospora nodorum]|nr:hypothetical protein HBH52_255400 [Parastagonospora nodorum]KAH4607665.1 hypothetical protein HBH82_095020 [Parastagonospora nodorum]KAH4710825.1 hypothetical protein HBH67_028280 [Parastagonospora nodorum]KAH4714869.1 hypothetical protein HBH78_039970 [Parastagonospora nodorum]KAH4784698.1 hypothetical protein HBH62_096950 [Parastagonospora nodorum]
MSQFEAVEQPHVHPTVSPVAQGLSHGSPIVEHDPWELKNILTLDGGGVRGYGSLLMLRVLMKAIRDIEQEPTHPDGKHFTSFHPLEDISTSLESISREHSPMADSLLGPSIADYLPCHYFDYIGGTSTGGLSAIMLGRLRMSVDQCVRNYPDMVTKIFDKKRLQIKGWPKAKYSATGLETTIKEIVRTRNGKDKDRYVNFKSPDDLCKTFVVAKRIVGSNSEEPHIFRTYSNHGFKGNWIPVTPGDANQEPIWQIGRATAAAPTYFKPIAIGDDLYSDGAVGYNNPAESGYSEVLYKERYYEKQSERDQQTAAPRIPIDLFLSIGTGGDDENKQPDGYHGPGTQRQRTTTGVKKPKKPSLLKHLRDMGKRLESEVTRAKEVDQRMREKSLSERWSYFRWTGGKDLAQVKLDKWERERKHLDRQGTQADIQDWVQDYMSGARQAEVQNIARALVNIRRRRIRYDDGDRWQRFAHCSHIKCPRCYVNTGKEFGTKAELDEHLRGCIVEERQTSQHWARVAPKIIGGPW